ncbi:MULTISPECIES: CdaR family transcriptional regulator [unclassified Mycolicibacterium]|uniref:PucR family transcriptional regulator n=1 Tax=unclassified Mycolicibacterium TaxID=2636767 RepID=UPI0012DD49C9|nr:MULTISPECIES: helix-turn-helix domain-containing protein [unclassified Mycolicibacterium]MUL83238.1 PucR family transcriptional regulator [Mycolicibacterium sp. CBMA 329]MUL89573.1 PucR family transcriptional regulator [Mycolicibacterium sp. CBMA 331]MUM02671.1 PucR family transcriptional regulator [Mycolicibacterium sp. CBMA 334]MUM28688.1 PucR family transcriptional regulator [Mycolicibacterium sp. CBMA 295]MUM39089.1 PucR family transcriptional regulator [Mycolicibacterium sp. CBMA 247]
MDPTVNEAIAVVTTRLINRQAEVARAVQRHLASDIADLRGDPEILELMASSVEGNIDTIFHALRHGIALDNIEAPTAALEYARRIAQRGVPMNALVRAYRLGHGMVLDVAAEEINQAGLDPATSLAVFERMTAVTFRYIDWITQQVEVVYEDERDRWLTNRNSTRALRVREVLSTATADPDALTAAIGYPMRRTHLAAVLWCPADSGHEDGLARLEQFLREVAESVAAQDSPLFVAADRGTGWGWIPLSPTTAPASVDKVKQFVTDHPDAPRVALGTPVPGVDGFRRSHRQARRAQEVAIAAGAARGTAAGAARGTAAGSRSVTAAGDPGLAAAALLGSNLDDARQWVTDVLGPLASDTANDARLRETLRVFLGHANSYKSAAEELNLHFNSVKYRVLRAQDRRGRPISEDRLDVELALLLCHWYGTAVLTAQQPS